jgi:tetratricopeptide (TPR) repeat protein
VPGLLDDDLRARLPSEPAEALLPLPGGRSLLEPRCRREPARVSRLLYDRLAAAIPDVGWLFAYAQHLGNNIHVNPWVLCREATLRLGEGGDGIALRLQERALACATPPAARGLLECMAGGWRIALHRYGELAEAPDPSPALPAVLRGALAQTKGWGLVMLGQAPRAEPYMREARELLRPHFEGRREYLYLQNIAALNRVNLGDVEGAFAAEQEIEARAARLQARDARLEYVNAINLARLQRRRGDLEAALRHYDRAFATTWGLRSENDLIYTNVCRARLETARGRHREAFLAWLRAALHWAAADLPEALGWRVASALLGRKPGLGEDVTEPVSSALVELLLGEARHEATEADDRGWVFRRAASLPRSTAFLSLLGEPGWSVVRTTASGSPAFDAPEARRLRGVLGRCVLALDGSAPDSPSGGLVVIDDRLGRELATTFSEAVESALRLGVPRIRYRGVEVLLPAALREALEEELWASLSPAVDRVVRREDAVVATFRRYRPPRLLAEQEAILLGLLDDGASVGELRKRCGPAPDLLSTLRALESERVVELRFADPARLEARLAPALAAPRDSG